MAMEEVKTTTETAGASAGVPAEAPAAAEAAAPVQASAIPAEELARLTDDIVSALKTVYDPEIPADIYELGLIYKIDIEDDRTIKIQMTLTATGCPVAVSIRFAARNGNRASAARAFNAPRASAPDLPGVADGPAGPKSNS